MTSPKETFLADYEVPAYLVNSVDLRFELAAAETRVVSILQIQRNPAESGGDLALDGEHITLVSIKLDGRVLAGNEYQRSDVGLLITQVPERFKLEIETLIQPDKNTALEGLYHSGGLLCTQCEAQGFRRITYYPDRPDVMAVFTVTLEADKALFPVLLANGNLSDSGDAADGKHWAKWYDPHLKPSYLFALVAGDLYCQQDSFTTQSGREVALAIYVDHENNHKCDHALRSLKQAMTWDENTYGCEYDLDVFMIVAVNDFNMGAMENKGLNIFNASCVLASPETATDDDYYTIQSIVGHEYFHNWSGNRVTCRDWFQLSLKEGFTVLRDQQFSADMNSEVVQRIADVNQLRTMQFAEDAGPMAHPVRPASFIEISNFYTVTIYEKGAEVVGMLKTLVGAAGFRKGTDLYFDRYDGQAVTTDDFVSAIEDANAIDLSQFKRWYSQAGTPVVAVKGDYDAATKRYTLTLSQSCPATPDQVEKLPFHIPITVGLLDKAGQVLSLQLEGESAAEAVTSHTLALREAKASFTFINIESEPVPSLLQGFSAPVKLEAQQDNDTLAFLMANDSDSFNRWDAGQTLLINVLLALVDDYQQQRDFILPENLLPQFKSVLALADAEPALVAMMLTLPSENYLAAQQMGADVDGIHAAWNFLRKTLANAFKADFESLYQRLKSTKEYDFNATDMAQRSLKNVCLSYLMATDDPMQVQRCLMQMKQANNMTDRMAGLRLMADQAGPESETALRSFYEQWQGDRQVVDKWLTVQAISSQPDTLIRIKGLLKHPAVSLTNPNNVRALIGQFCRNNPINFHAKDGSGYTFLADQICQLDDLNAQVAARQMGALGAWRQYDVARQTLMKSALQKIADKKDLSRDVYEIVTKYLAES